jgi:transposase
LILKATERYELIRPILTGKTSIKERHEETGVPLSTLYHYLKRFREGGEQIESLADKSSAAHSHPNWFTEEDKDKVIQYKLHHPERSARQIAKDLATEEILQINYHSVADILKQRQLAGNFFWTNQGN